ncbi:sensor histidine kinase [Rhodoferax sp.]|uniref:sensor histidine kinase n=1 Tax=Rhodoferax sp. TaxID=50421 RepID=UPI001EBB2836|nr:sensor histidine kinase [Rhodoferax sp.]MBT9506912.1 HAMP domain-containing protein [Rhodoferax sp.]
MPMPLETRSGRLLRAGKRFGLNLFWRTFFLLALLLIGSVLAWLQTLRALEFEPRAIQTAQQIASLVNLSRAALIHSDAIARVSLIKTMTEQEGVRIVPREPGDTFEPFDTDSLGRRISQELKGRLGPGTVVANSVNQEEGLWVGFMIDGDNYWMLTDRARFNRTAGRTWMIWLMTAAALSLAGAALIARLINRPLKQLSFAASRVRDGDFEASSLDETVATSEIRAVNIGFNRMTQKLAKIEQDRAIMLAGISHDLRTPLARLRLETELSVADTEARAHMAADIVQLDAIIDKFLEYARPGNGHLEVVSLRDVIDSCIYSIRNRTDMRFNLDLADNLSVLADQVELARVITNLLENAGRYGKSVNTGIAVVDIAAKEREQWILLRVRDHGMGVSPEQLLNLTKPFYRGEAARTAANGAGLGLAIVEKTIVRMGGTFMLSNTSSGGLAANIKLQRAPKA